METMETVVKYGQEDDRVELRDVPVPVPGDVDVLLRVKAAGICGSDIEMWRHRFTYGVNTPVIQRHEFCGVVEWSGPALGGQKQGDRVVSETFAYVCGRCRFCRTGDYNMCPSRLGFGYGTNGAFTRFVAVRQQILHLIPASLSFEESAIAQPACVAYNALVVRSRIRPGDCVVVIGPGPIGVNCIQVAAAVYLTGYGTTASLLVTPDIGFVTLSDMCGVVRNICNAIDTPLIADAESGFANAVNLTRVVREYEQAGAAAIHLEDQIVPKKYGGEDTPQVVPFQEHAATIRIAVRSRRSDDFLIIGRTDCLERFGLDEAIRRGNAY